MKNFSPGLSDSIACLTAELAPCPDCGSSSSVAGGLCVGCLLQNGLAPEEDCTPETLESALAEVAMPDKNWRLGNYEILEEIGRGGMGVIYRARQRHSRRIVAVKRILGYHADSGETLARFRREAQAVASLDHPNILPIYEVNESEEGLPFFSMKFAPGGSLAQAGSAFRSEPRQCVALMAKITRAVEHAHRNGILHRDLKPGNILLDGRGEPYVSDFGLAKWLETTSDLTRTLTIFGTPGYIAPEQVSESAASVKPTADVYSLGAILFDLLTGRPPFLGSHALSVIKQATELPAPKLCSFSKVADRDLQTICARCLEREPQARYRSAGDLAEDLERWLEGRPIIARPVVFPVRLWRWARRNPVLAATAAACALLAAVGIYRQIESHLLASSIREKELALHSVTVLPFLNLDGGHADAGLSKRVADGLQKQASDLGLSRIQTDVRPSQKWTGIGTQDEVRLAANQFHSRAVLTGTTRQVGDKTRLSIHLIKENGHDLMDSWIVDSNGGQETVPALVANGVGHRIYQLLDGTVAVATDTQAADDAMLNDTARGYMNAGRGLLDRRTIADMDRAIACFQGAIREAPRSVAAHSYLALAYMGRNFLTRDPLLVDRALQEANEAVKLSPNDSSANRSLSAIYILTGQYTDALEHGFRSLEAAGPSERAFGQVAFAWKMLGHPEKAILWFQKAKVTERQPADYDVHIGDCWTLLGADSEAQESFETAMRFRPDLPEGWLGLCNLKLVQGDIDGARKLFQERAAEYGHFHTAKQMEAAIEFFARNFSEAEKLYTDLQRSDANGDGSQQYGIISYKSALARSRKDSNPKSATALIDECLATDAAALTKTPKHPEVLYRLAATEAIQNKTDSALHHFRAAIDAGWIDYRSPRLDPRFDSLAANPAFQTTFNDLASQVAGLRRHLRADKPDKK